MTMMAGPRERRKDRLSSLPDAILIEIISLLPLESAIATDVLSRRWRHLWTHSSAISFDKLTSGLYKTFDQIMHKLTSPFIHAFTIEFQCVYHLSNDYYVLLDSWLRLIRQRNVRHLNLSFPNCYSVYRSLACIFETTSLVSLKLRPGFVFNHDLINLPYLKKLDIYILSTECEWFNKLITLCPLLEDLSFIFRSTIYSRDETSFVSCSSLSLRRLSINLLSCKPPTEVFIDAPKLEYFSVDAPKLSSFFFGDKPVSLQQADIQLWDERVGSLDDETGLISSTLYQGISNVRILADSSWHFNVLSTFKAFPNLTRLTLSMKRYDNCISLLKFLTLCPLLDVLILNFGHMNLTIEDDVDEMWVLPKPASDAPLGRVKRIEIDTSIVLDYECYLYFSELVGYMLRSAPSLEYLHFSVDGKRQLGIGIVYDGILQSEELEYWFCNMIYKCQMASKKCELVFTGKDLVMSRKAGARRPVIRQDNRLL